VLNIDKEVIGSNANFFELGGHSLKATALVSRIHKEFNVNIPLTEIFVLQTISALAGYIRNAEQEMFVTIAPLEKREYYQLSPAQKRLYILGQMNLAGAGYNIPLPIFLNKDPDKERLNKTFQRLIQRYESFRTSFEMVNAEPVQKVHKNVKFEIEYQEAGQPLQGPGSGVETDEANVNVEIEKMFEDFVRPFDLGKAPLLRVRLLITPLPRQNILLVDMHHIISDGTSVEILREEFQAIYDGQELPVLSLQYKDYANWQNSRQQQQEIKRQKTYWLNQFPDEVPILKLPTDYPRPVVQSFEGNTVSFVLNAAETESINKITRETDTTLYMALFSIYNILLAKLSGQEEIIIGTPIAGRNHSDLEPIIGMFVNTLALRNVPAGDKTVKEFLKEVKENTLNAFENQEYQFEDLVEKLSLARDASRNPLFDVMFNFITRAEPRQSSASFIGKEQYVYRKGMAKFDMTITAAVLGKQFYITFTYCTRLFQLSTIQRFIGYFRKIVSLLGLNINRKISTVEIISHQEKEQLLYDFNKTKSDYPEDKTIHCLFEEQVEKSHDHTAVLFHDRALTYRQLNRSANRLAKVLIRRGLQPGHMNIVGILFHRCPEVIVCILAVLKAGAAYLPIDPDYPSARIKYMLADSQAVLLLTGGDLYPGLEYEGSLEVLKVEDEPIYSAVSQDSLYPSGLAAASRDIAYIIYTSGSTGRPRGVIIEHVSVVNLVVYQCQWFGITGRERILQFSSISFDASVEQIFVAFYSGAGLVLVDREILLDAKRFEEYVRNHSVTHIHAVPSFLSTINNQQYKALKRIVAGGDICPPALAARWSTACKFYNKYGPTETTVTSIELSVDELAESTTQLPIGKAVANTTVYILDRWQQPVPLAVTGELHIGGHGVARGYLNNPQQTHDNFQDNPFLKGERFYRTGDLCRWLTNGNVEFLGRIDQQVKIRGFRIDLGEIESQLLKYDAIKEAVVVARAASKGDKYLCAYIVARPKPGDAAGHFADTLDSSALRDYLSKILPGYMIPSYFVPLEKIPLTPNGKVDRKALPEPEMAAGEDYIAPRIPREN
jgi:bacitracin synthase 3